MSNETILKIMTNHSVPTRIESGRILASDIFSFRDDTAWIDVTGWTVDQIRDWLGY